MALPDRLTGIEPAEPPEPKTFHRTKHTEQ